VRYRPQPDCVIVDDFALPSGEEADRLLQGLGRLIQLRGAETFLSAPLLLAEPQFFPDAVAPRARGVAVLLRRLLAYAGLEAQRLEIEIYGDATRDPHVVLDQQAESAAAWFMDIAEGVYRFGVRETELRDEQALVGTLGHEVAHAYRAHHGLQVVSRDVEELLTDLTTVYLGFGVFTLESSFRFKTGHLDASGQRLLYERQLGGYLRPGELAFLLGAQLVVRAEREALLEAALASLSHNQAAALRAAVAQLSQDLPGLQLTLGLPDMASWPRPRQIKDTLAPLPEAAVVIHDRPKASREKRERDQFAFRVAGNRLTSGVALAGAAGFALALGLELQLAFWPCVLGLAALGGLVGRARAAPTCSACGRSVSQHAARCSSCDVPLVGAIGSTLEYFDAEERYRAGQPDNASGRREQARASAKQRCPACQWIPLDSDRWLCSCGETWNTFDTAGRCPGCDKQWEATACLSCDATSTHRAWYVPTEK
jgi:hypothetical protein